MKHIYQEGNQSKNTLLLLHGTGGNEYDLLPLAEIIDPDANILSVRGNVLENRMPRFFRRLAEGVFDEQDLIARTAELKAFIDEAAENYQFERNRVIAIGYSNGANIAASLLYHFADALAGAILHHPMVPRRGITLPNLDGTNVWIGAGKFDPMCSPEEAQELQKTLLAAGANTEIFWTEAGHQLVQEEVIAAKAWYKLHF